MYRNRIVYSLFTAAAAGCGLALTGCEASIHTEPEHHAYVEHREVVTEAPPPVVVERERPPVVVERDRGPVVVYERGAVYHERRNVSYLVARGHQKTSYNANHHGHITVVDDNTGRIEVSHEVRGGDRIAFDPDKNKAWLNGHTILDHDLNSHHVYSMYFDPD